MSRPLRIEFPGAVYHVTVRGNERRETFRDDEDRIRFLTMLGEATARFGWIVTAYVLMSNHFHVMLELTTTTLSSGLKWLNGRYAQSFNKRHDRVGHLFQGRFNARLIEKETYHLNVLRYVVLNPVRAGIVEKPADYEWSSYRATAGLAAAPNWLSVDEVLRTFGGEPEVARARYRRFIADGIGDEQTPWADLAGQIYLGSSAWVARMREKVTSQPRDSEHPRAQRQVDRWQMADVVGSVAGALGLDERVVRNDHGGPARMLAAWLGCHEGLLTRNAIAAGLRLRSAGHVTELIQKCDRELGRDPEFRRDLARCRDMLYLV